MPVTTVAHIVFCQENGMPQQRRTGIRELIHGKGSGIEFTIDMAVAIFISQEGSRLLTLISLN